MTKSILKSILASAAFVAGSFITNNAVAQNGAVTSAEYLISPESRNYEKALDKIRQATYHEKTKDKVKTYYVRAKVFTAILQAGLEDEKVAALVTNPADSAFEAMVKVKEMEKAAGEDKYTEQLTNISTEGLNVLPSLENQLKNAVLIDVQKYQETDFERAYNAVVPLVNYFKGDTTLLTYAGYFANKAEKLDKAGYYFEQLGDVEGYNSSDAYQSAVSSYYQVGDTVKLLNVVEKAKQKYPEEKYFLLMGSDIYRRKGDYEKAIEYLQKASELDPKNVQYLTSLARMSNEIEKKEDAYSYYAKVVDIEKDNEEAVRALGAGYYEDARKIYDELEGEATAAKKSINKEDKRYKEMIILADKAIPYLMMYKDISEDKSIVYSTLANIYLYKGNDAKFEEMKKLAKESK